MTTATGTPTGAPTSREAKEAFEQFTSKVIDGFSLWADANQKVLRQLVDLSSATAAESVRVQAELQSAAVQALKNGQDYIRSQQTSMTELSKDPAGTYQKGIAEGLEGVQRAFRLLESNAEAISKSADRLQQSAEQASKEIQSTFASLAGQLKTLYTPSAK